MIPGISWRITTPGPAPPRWTGWVTPSAVNSPLGRSRVNEAGGACSSVRAVESTSRAISPGTVDTAEFRAFKSCALPPTIERNNSEPLGWLTARWASTWRGPVGSSSSAFTSPAARRALTSATTSGDGEPSAKSARASQKPALRLAPAIEAERELVLGDHPLADELKLLTKEDVVPLGANRILHLIAPVIAAVPALIAYAIIPYGSTYSFGDSELKLVAADPDWGLLYIFVIGRGLYIATQAGDTYSRLLAGSISLTFFVYVFVNTAMVTGLVPVVGIPLPLVSFGGTSMVTLMAGFGILMSIHNHRKLLPH